MNIDKIFGTITSLVESMVPMILGLFGYRTDVQRVQDKVIEMCGFLPTATSVAAMLAASNPVVSGVVGVATAICQAVTRSKQSVYSVMSVGGSNVPLGTVNGVPIEGDFVGE